MKNEIENKLTKLFAELITSLGEDIHRKGLVDTPQRAADAFRFLTQGYGMDIHSVVNGALFNCDNKEMVVVKNIELFSANFFHLSENSGWESSYNSFINRYFDGATIKINSAPVLVIS